VLAILEVVRLEDGLGAHVVAVGDGVERVPSLDDVRDVGAGRGGEESDAEAGGERNG
jgi:hypothetical protein